MTTIHYTEPLRGTRIGAGPSAYPVKDYVYNGSQPEPVGQKSGPKPKPYDPDLCGSKEGYKQHVRFRDEKCQPCKDAYAAYQREVRAGKKEA